MAIVRRFRRNSLSKIFVETIRAGNELEGMQVCLRVVLASSGLRLDDHSSLPQASTNQGFFTVAAGCQILSLPTLEEPPLDCDFVCRIVCDVQS